MRDRAVLRPGKLGQGLREHEPLRFTSGCSGADRAMRQVNAISGLCVRGLVGRGGLEPPAFRFSGGRSPN
jgi:hypothetical protein